MQPSRRTGTRTAMAGSPSPAWPSCGCAQGDAETAAAAIRRALDETSEPLQRAALLPAYTEIMLAVDDVEEAHNACRELGEIAAGSESAMLGAIAAHARGAVALAGENAAAGL